MARILIIDDSRTARRMLRNILTAEGHEIIGQAENGQSGYEMFMKLKPDIVTLDIIMPVLDGLGALKKIMVYDPDAHVIMISSAGQKEKVVTAVKLGALDFVQKPYLPEQISDIVARLEAITS